MRGPEPSGIQRISGPVGFQRLDEFTGAFVGEEQSCP